MEGSEFVFDYVQLLYYNFHRINPNRGGSYTNSPDWIKNKKAAINLINKEDNNVFNTLQQLRQIIKKKKKIRKK